MRGIELRGEDPAAAIRAATWTDAVLRESMRLYPPAWIVARAAAEPLELDGEPVPAGSFVFTSPWAMHRDPRFWREPEIFAPARFADPDARRPRAWFPFGAGQRKCLGEHFAMLEATLVLAVLSQRLRLSLVPGQTIEPEPSITLRPNGPVWMQVG